MTTNIAQVAREGGDRIARALNMRKGGGLVHRDNQRRFDQALKEMAQTPDQSGLARLRGLLEGIPRRRELQAAVALLDQAWRLPKGSRLEEDVVTVIRRCYLNAPKDKWKELIRDELEDRKWSAFPAVRRVVQLVRHLDPVDEHEIDDLNHLDRGYADLRIAVAERAVIHNQEVFLEPVLQYLELVVVSEMTDDEERKEVSRIFNLLATQFNRTPETLAVLFRHYCDLYDRQEPRGYLMRALGFYGEAIVPQLLDAHAGRHMPREAIEHLLGYMVANGSPAAVRSLANIIGDSYPAQVSSVCQRLVAGVERWAMNRDRADALAVQVAVNEVLPTLERLPYRNVKEAVVRLKGIEWGKRNTTDILNRVLDGTRSEGDLHQLRRQARDILQPLLTAVSDTHLSTAERGRALAVFGRLRGALKEGSWTRANTATVLWDVFQGTTDITLREAVLSALEALKLDPGEAARQVLFDLRQNGPQSLRDAILRVWPAIFPSVSLPVTNQRSGPAL